MIASEELALLRACKADPDDDGARLILADWLDEHGQTDRAALVRLQCAHDRLPEDDPRRDPLEAAAEKILERCNGAWSSQVRQVVGKGLRGANWFGGLLTAWVEPARLSKLARPELLDSVTFGWVREVQVIHSRVRSAHVEKPIFGSWLKRVVSLSLIHCELPRSTLEVLAGLRTLGSVRRLSFYGSDGPVWPTLTRMPALRQVTSLDLGATYPRAEDVDTFFASARLGGLTHLDLLNNNLGPAGVEALATSRSLTGLRQLVLETNDIGNRGLAVLATSPVLRNVRSLNLQTNDLGPGGFEFLADSPHAAGLENLNVCNNAVGADGVRALARSRSLTRLRVLDLTGNEVGDEGVEALAASPNAATLTNLVLTGNELTDHSLRALARSDHLARLEVLDIGFNRGFTAAAVKELDESPRLSALLHINLRHTGQGNLRLKHPWRASSRTLR